MNISKVLVCAGLIGLAMAMAFGSSAMLLGESSVVASMAALAPFLFSLFCFAFIGVGRLTRIVIQKRREERRERDRQRRARQKRMDQAFGSQEAPVNIE
jgi:phosphate/sulfate permease